MWEEIFKSFFESLFVISPQIFWAGLVLLLGILFAKWAGRVSVNFFNKIRLNQALKRIGLEEALLRFDVNLDAPDFLGEIVKWLFIIIFLMASSEILGLPQLSQLLREVLAYFPNIFVAVLIALVAAFLADFSQKIVVGSLEKEKIAYSRFLGRGFSSAIWILAILAILYQLKIVQPLILSIFIGVTAIIVLAIGIAFGLGGKDLAAKILKELEEKLK